MEMIFKVNAEEARELNAALVKAIDNMMAEQDYDNASWLVMVLRALSEQMK